MRSTVLVALLAVSTNAWVPANVGSRPMQRFLTTSTTTSLNMAMDYKDPVVAAEFAKVQPMTWEEVEEELISKGIPVRPTMNEMDIKLMLVEMRLRLAGKLEGQKKKERPAKFSSKFEEAMWTKPAFQEFYNELKTQRDHNAQNVVAEFLNNPELAEQRYGKDYKGLLRRAKEALDAPPPVKSPTLKFSGFPANMGQNACRMTLEALGEVKEFECEVDEDVPILKGKVTYDNIESAKKAVAQYNGMNMGLGTVLELVSV